MAKKVNKNEPCYIVKAEGQSCCLFIISYLTQYDMDRLDAMVNGMCEEQGLTELKIVIDSMGGDAWAAQRIGNLIDKFEGTTWAHVELVAASAASYVLAKCQKRTISANGQVMIHKPSLYADGNEDELAAQLPMIQSITSDFRTVYAKCMNITEDEVEAMWKNEKWMDAQTALSLGVVTEVIDVTATSTPEVMAAMIEVGRIKKPEIPNSDYMKKSPKVLAALALSADATDEQFDAAVEQLAAENVQLKAKNEDLSQKLLAEQTSKVTALVDAAVQANKITEAERPAFVKLATADFESTAAILKSRTPHVSASSRIGANGGNEDKYADWNYDRLQKEAPKVLAQIKAEDPERFEQLRKEYIAGERHK